jgi:FtsZ-interacting cell division protein ZipA
MTFYFAPVFKYIFLYVLICLLLIAGFWTNMVSGNWLSRRRRRERRSRTVDEADQQQAVQQDDLVQQQAAPQVDDDQQQDDSGSGGSSSRSIYLRGPARTRESPSASHTSGQATADSAGWGEVCNFMFFILVHIMCSKS